MLSGGWDVNSVRVKDPPLKLSVGVQWSRACPDVPCKVKNGYCVSHPFLQRRYLWVTEATDSTRSAALVQTPGRTEGCLLCGVQSGKSPRRRSAVWEGSLMSQDAMCGSWKP